MTEEKAIKLLAGRLGYTHNFYQSKVSERWYASKPGSKTRESLGDLFESRDALRPVIETLTPEELDLLLEVLFVNGRKNVRTGHRPSVAKDCLLYLLNLKPRDLAILIAMVIKEIEP